MKTLQQISAEIDSIPTFEAVHKMATAAHHMCGSISRKEDLCIVSREFTHLVHGPCYVGNWCSGLGFFNVMFPKATTRDLTDDEQVKYGLRLPADPAVVELDGWSLVSNQDGYKAPECVVTRLSGICKGHPRAKDGESITTSPITGQRLGMVATCRTLYRLGTIDPEYLARYPKVTVASVLAKLPIV